MTALAVLRAYGETIFYATTPAVIKAVHARAGLSVRQGDVLYELTSPKLENEARKLTADLAAADWRISLLRLNNPRLKARGFLTRCRLSRNRQGF